MQNDPTLEARIAALEAENARLRGVLLKSRNRIELAEHINLIGRTPTAKIASTLRKVLFDIRAALEEKP
jgi:hypothetical protein